VFLTPVNREPELQIALKLANLVHAIPRAHVDPNTCPICLDTSMEQWPGPATSQPDATPAGARKPVNMICCGKQLCGTCWCQYTNGASSCPFCRAICSPEIQLPLCQARAKRGSADAYISLGGELMKQGDIDGAEAAFRAAIAIATDAHKGFAHFELGALLLHHREFSFPTIFSELGASVIAAPHFPLAIKAYVRFLKECGFPSGCAQAQLEATRSGQRFTNTMSTAFESIGHTQ
jgi:hypothetical protein